MAVLLAPLLAACGLRAQLVLTINTINKTYWWTGSASISGTLESGGILYARLTGGGGNDPSSSLGYTGLNFSVTAFNPYEDDNTLYVDINGFYMQPFFWWNDTDHPLPYAGTFSPANSGSPLSYDNGDTGAASYVLAFDGLPITFNGTGEQVGSVSVILPPPPPSAVPEPATYALVLGCIALGGIAWRRRRRTPAPMAGRGA